MFAANCMRARMSAVSFMIVKLSFNCCLSCERSLLATCPSCRAPFSRWHPCASSARWLQATDAAHHRNQVDDRSMSSCIIRMSISREFCIFTKFMNTAKTDYSFSMNSPIYMGLSLGSALSRLEHRWYSLPSLQKAYSPFLAKVIGTKSNKTLQKNKNRKNVRAT